MNVDADTPTLEVDTSDDVSRETSPDVDSAVDTAALSSSLWSIPWAIDAAALPLRVSEPQAAPMAPGDHRQPRAGQVAVVRAAGIVLPRCSPGLESYGYAISCEGLPARLEALADEGCAAIAVLIDSPGGSVAGVDEAARRIAAVSARVPVVAVADHMAASGAYWLASAATAVVASPSAVVGSIGVYAVRPSFARELDAAGIDIDVFWRGEGKVDGLMLVEMTDAGRRRWQSRIDAYYAMFTTAVAAGRGVTRRTVEQVWGAQLLTAQAARTAGMTDQTATAADVVERLATAAGRRAYRRVGAARAIVRAVATGRGPNGGTR